MNNPTKHLRDYLSIGGVELEEDIFHINNATSQNIDLPATIDSIETL